MYTKEIFKAALQNSNIDIDALVDVINEKCYSRVDQERIIAILIGKFVEPKISEISFSRKGCKRIFVKYNRITNSVTYKCFAVKEMSFKNERDAIEYGRTGVNRASWNECSSDPKELRFYSCYGSWVEEKTDLANW